MTRARPTSVAPGEDRAQDLAGALHEVSNALTVVLGWLDVARARVPEGPEREALEVARTHARLGYGIARKAIGAEMPETGSAQTTARLAAHTALTGVTPEANRCGIELVLDEAGAAHPRIGDSGAALQILTNLLFNAIAFTPRGGRVHLALRDEDSRVVFRVSDEGPGLSEDLADSIFEGPSSTRKGGAGVGLKHSHALAELHGGCLTVARSIGPGACFELSWPVAEARSSARPQRVRIGNVRGTRVLVVEDDAAVRSLIELALEARGVEPTLVGSAAELELALARGPYDVALIDLSPIAADAPSTFARLRQSSPGLSVILISGVASGVPEELEREVAAWVRKPFEMTEVLEVMARLLAARPAESATG